MSTELATSSPGAAPEGSHNGTRTPIQVTALEATRTAFGLLQSMTGVLPGPANVVVALGQHIVTIIDDIKTNQELCEIIRDRTSRLVLVVTMKQQRVKDEDIPQSVKEQMRDLCSKLTGITRRLEDIRSRKPTTGLRGLIKDIVFRKDIASSLQKCASDLDWEIRAFQVDTELEGAIQRATITASLDVVKTGVQDLILDVGIARETVITSAERDRINQLPRSKRASWRAQEAAHGCIDGTRVDLLADIHSWVADFDAPPILWVHGMAGAGKTTIAYSVAERAEQEEILGASYFFSQDGEVELSDPSLVIPTIAHQLAAFSKDFCKQIAEALMIDPDAAQASRTVQCEKLIISPLCLAAPSPKRVVLLILDAFDECKEAGAPELLRTLLDASPRLPFVLKVFITSRPEPYVERMLGRATFANAINLNDIDDAIVFKDVGTYLRSSLLNDDWRRQFSLPTDWIAPTKLDELARKAGKLFIVASISVLFIGDNRVRDPCGHLDIILGFANSTTARPYLTLDALYTKILENTVSGADEDRIVRRFRAVMGAIFTCGWSRTLTLPILDELGGEAGTTLAALEHLRSVVIVHKPARSETSQETLSLFPKPIIEFCHPSFPDYLRDRTRCTDKRFQIDVRQGHTQLARQCLKLLISAIEKERREAQTRNVLSASIDSGPGSLFSQFLQSESALEYAKGNWRMHLRSADWDDQSLKVAYSSFCLLCLPDKSPLGRVSSARLDNNAGERALSLRPSSLKPLGLASPAFGIFLCIEQDGYLGSDIDVKVTSVYIIERKGETERLAEVGAQRKMLWYAPGFDPDITAILMHGLPMVPSMSARATSEGVYLFSSLSSAVNDLPGPQWLVLCEVTTGSTPLPPGSTQHMATQPGGGKSIASDLDETGEAPELKELRDAMRGVSSANEEVQTPYSTSQWHAASDAAHICPRYLLLITASWSTSYHIAQLMEEREYY